MKKPIAYAKKVKYNYEIIEKVEAGIVLVGTEIKSIRINGMNISEAFVNIRDNQIWLVNSIINEYKFANQFNHEISRTRKLLLHKREINKLRKLKEQQGLTIVPLEAYLKDNYLKIVICLAKGKKNYDKRETIKKRDFERKVKKYV